jgi:hypothetical protein
MMQKKGLVDFSYSLGWDYDSFHDPLSNFKSC